MPHPETVVNKILIWLIYVYFLNRYFAMSIKKVTTSAVEFCFIKFF